MIEVPLAVWPLYLTVQTAKLVDEPQTLALCEMVRKGMSQGHVPILVQPFPTKSHNFVHQESAVSLSIGDCSRLL